MNPDIFEQWIKILRNLIIVSIGGFMLVYETIFVSVPNYLIIAAGLALLGVPPALNLDGRLRTRKNGDDKNA